MPVNIGPVKIKVALDKEAFEEDMQELLDEEALNRMFNFEDTFGDLHEQFAVVIDDMLNLQNKSRAMVTAVAASFQVLTTALNVVGDAWHEMLLTGEMSWKTFGEAMKTMVAQELAAISASALVNALYATAIGLIRLAQWDFGAAASAFAAAATFGLVAAAAGAGAVALSAGAGSSGGFDEGGGFGDGGGFDDDRINALEQKNQQRFMNLTVNGNIIGQEDWVRNELIPQLNSIVTDSDGVFITSDRSNISRSTR
ncbi:MAG: hypothetical protein KAJ19_00440 [Gammaproteobacteria bacterium]|nr:hypothetical protein [Gammaproteobacteria bacterium]